MSAPHHDHDDDEDGAAEAARTPQKRALPADAATAPEPPPAHPTPFTLPHDQPSPGTAWRARMRQLQRRRPENGWRTFR